MATTEALPALGGLQDFIAQHRAALAEQQQRLDSHSALVEHLSAESRACHANWERLRPLCLTQRKEAEHTLAEARQTIASIDIAVQQALRALATASEELSAHSEDFAGLVRQHEELAQAIKNTHEQQQRIYPNLQAEIERRKSVVQQLLAQAEIRAKENDETTRQVTTPTLLALSYAAFTDALHTVFQQLEALLNESVTSQFQATVRPQVNAAFERVTKEGQTTIPIAAVKKVNECFVERLGPVLSATLTTYASDVMSLTNEEKESQLMQEIQKLVDRRSFEEAFNRTLSQKSSVLLAWLCSTVNGEEVLQPNVLSANTLLALLHQLSYVVASAPSALQWIREVLLCLESQPAFAPVIRAVIQKLEVSEQQSQDPAQKMELKEVIFMARGLVKTK